MEPDNHTQTYANDSATSSPISTPLTHDGSRPVHGDWQPIESAPKDGTRIRGRRTYADRYTGRLRYETHKTFFGKASHVPLYGWHWGSDPENQHGWEPTHWRPL